jgi:predicted transcriptional regulator
MPKREKTALTKLELQIMQVLWKLGPSTVNGVQDALQQDLAYTTVQTMLNILERKGKLKRKLLGRSYEYTPVVSEEHASGHALRDLIDRVFAGSSEDLVMSLLRTRQIDAKTIARLTRRLEEQSAESPKSAKPSRKGERR